MPILIQATGTGPEGRVELTECFVRVAVPPFDPLNWESFASNFFDSRTAITGMTYANGPARGSAVSYHGATLIPDGRVVLGAHLGTRVDLFDPATNTLIPGPSHGFSGAGAYAGQATLQDGRVMFVPHSAPRIGLFNPTNNSFQQGPTVPGGPAYHGAVRLLDGRVVLIPWQSATIGIYDPVSDTITAGPAHGRGANAFASGCLAPDGRVILIPYMSTVFGIYNPATNAYTNGPAHGRSPDTYQGARLIRDGRIVCAPRGAGAVDLFDPETNTRIAGPLLAVQNVGAVCLPTSDVCFVPLLGNTLRWYNPVSHTVQQSTAVAGWNSPPFVGGCLLPDGRILFSSWGHTHIGIVTPNPLIPVDINVLLSPFNNYW